MGDTYPTVTAAAVQAAPVFLDREASLDKACRFIEEAGENGADVVVFPEGYLPGHPLWYHSHGVTSELSSRLATRLFTNAIEVPGPVTERLASAAERTGTYVIMGACEKVPGTTGTMYNTQLYFSPSGELLGKHQKLRPTVGERLVHHDGRPDTFGAVDTEFGPMSGLICGENSNPLAIFALAAEHTRIHGMSWPAANFFSTTEGVPDRRTMVARAFAQMTKSYVVSAHGVISDRHIQPMELDEPDSGREFEPTHGSVIVDPGMRVIAGPMDPGEEGILYGTCDLGDCVRKKVTHDFAGHYNRRDMFQVRLDRRAPELFSPLEADDSVAAESSTPDRTALGDDPVEGSAPSRSQRSEQPVDH